ncbi:(d)CMP kinase [Faecalibaculum rodentium]|jgi:cytidylate kinase|uniref:Cytidylate kinase n=2 Tax=Faecalibaculum rodentium TaxID=1702221 RepID=A0A140DUT5_9FIRM|nr:(d)CMP kinase [Faecalibaculum rodentium]AMK54412.1 cytidylate kinase [Faecalibaculum rodentium]
MQGFNVAIDGTSGVGKSSAADLLADANQMIHLDTGAMYRCVALAMEEAGIDPEDESELQSLLDTMKIRFEGRRVFLNDREVTTQIRTNRISNLTSRIAALPAVRARMTGLQQQTTAAGGYIVDGRDIGTVVLPDAAIKIFLSARPEARARRRYDEYRQKGIDADYDRILEDIRQRDWQDSHRSTAPLKKAEDAVEIDTSDLTLDQVVTAIQSLIDGARK